MVGKVKIKKAGMWYKTKVGETFNVVDKDDKFYLVERKREDGAVTREWVRKRDVEVMEVVEPEEKAPPKKKQGGGVFSKDDEGKKE